MAAYHQALPLALLLGACQPPQPEAAAARPHGPESLLRAGRAAPRTGLNDPDRPLPPLRARVGDDLEGLQRRYLGEQAWAKVPRLPAPPSPLAEIANTITRAETDPTRGQALVELLADKPSSLIDLYGLAAATYDEQMVQGLCENPALTWEFEEEGTDYEGALEVGTYIQFVGDIVPELLELTASCAVGLLDAGGDIEAAVSLGDCTGQEAHDFFGEPGSDHACRSCVESSGGDFATCVEADACEETAQGTTWVEEDGEQVYYDTMIGYIWGCAPDYTIFTYLLGDVNDDGTVPVAFDAAAWAHICVPFYDDEADTLQWVCASGDGGPKVGDTLGEGFASGYVDYIRQPGEDTRPWHGRGYYADAATLRNGTELRWFYAWNPGSGAVSAPWSHPDTNGSGALDVGDENFGYSYGGWGLNPYEKRPDGEHQARDWVGMITLKSSTTRNGIHVLGYNASRCAEDGWAGPDADGAYTCVAPITPIVGWLNGGGNVSTDSDYSQFYPFPISTLASTGLPDPDVPGGVVVHEAGSDRVANPDWDDCGWPHRFETDRIAFPDVPDAWDGGPASLWGDTYRFGKDGDDIRVVIATNTARDYCPADADGDVWRTHVEYVPEPGD